MVRRFGERADLEELWEILSISAEGFLAWLALISFRFLCTHVLALCYKSSLGPESASTYSRRGVELSLSWIPGLSLPWML